MHTGPDGTVTWPRFDRWHTPKVIQEHSPQLDTYTPAHALLHSSTLPRPHHHHAHPDHGSLLPRARLRPGARRHRRRVRQGGLLRGTARPTLTLLLLLPLRACVCALTLKVSHAPMMVECLACSHSMTLPRGPGMAMKKPASTATDSMDNTDMNGKARGAHSSPFWLKKTAQGTGARAKAWCLLLHAEASISLSPTSCRGDKWRSVRPWAWTP